MLTREDVIGLVVREDHIGMHAVGRALVHLLNRQTKEEAIDNTTRVFNNRGFAPADAKRGCISAKYYIKHKKLEDWQLKIWREVNKNGIPRIAKYWSQLAEEAQKRQGSN